MISVDEKFNCFLLLVFTYTISVFYNGEIFTQNNSHTNNKNESQRVK